MMMNAKKSSKVNITRYLLLVPAVMLLLMVFSVSKAEMSKAVKTSKHMISDIQSAITKITINAANTATTPINADRAKTTFLKAISIFTIHTDSADASTTERAHTDSGSKQKLFFVKDISVTGPEKPDLLFARKDTDVKATIKLRGTMADTHPDIYINGVKIETDLSAINPNSIESINVIKDKTSPPNGAIYIITKDRAATGLRTDTILVKSVAGRINHVSLTKPADVADNEVTVVGYPTKITNIRINGKALAVKDANAKRVIGTDTLYNGVTVVTTKKLDTLMRKLPGMEVMPDGTLLHKAQGVPIRQAITLQGYASHASVASIKLSDKLIIINGKEASAKELKKISADKIESVSNLNAESAKTLYGDKAKNGVVVITTKK